MTVQSTSGLIPTWYLNLILVDRLGKCIRGTPCFLSWVLDYSRNNPKRVGGGGGGDLSIYIHFWKKTLGLYRFVTLPLEDKLSPLEISQICATPLRNSKMKYPRPTENPHDFFLITYIKSTSFFIDSQTPACFFQYPLKFHALNFACSGFLRSRVVIKSMFG